MEEIAEPTNYKSLLITKDMDFFIRNDGAKVNAEEAFKGKSKIGLYFSAHWCGPCRRFTPEFVKVYNAINEKCDGSFEVVFVSGDEDDESFKEYFKEMPWLAVPFEDKEGRESLDEAFEVQGIPHLVVIDGVSGKLVQSDCVGLVTEHGAEAFPFTEERVEELREIEENIKRNQTVTSVLTTASRDYVLSPDGTQVQVSKLEGKMVGIYFSVNGHGNCVEFSKILFNMYSELKKRGKAFEVVLVCLDNEEEDYKEIIKDFPCLALPFKDESIKKLIRYFELETLPTLVLLGVDGKTINNNLVEVVEEHGDSAYPFSPEKLAELMELEKKRMAEQTLESILVQNDLDYVIGKDGMKVLVKDLVGKTVLIYFSAHWCPPCRGFTPKLVNVYNEMKTKKYEVEVIFVSSDQDQSSFDEYYSSMPWLALPFGDKRKNFLSRKFKVQGIPTLVAINISGRTITTDARELVLEHGAKAFPFTDERRKQLEEEANLEANSWPDKVKHKTHEHELVKTKRNRYNCDGCEERGSGWSFYCSECDFDLHPKCALHEENAEMENGGYICDGDVCRKA